MINLSIFSRHLSKGMDPKHPTYLVIQPKPTDLHKHFNLACQLITNLILHINIYSILTIY